MKRLFLLLTIVTAGSLVFAHEFWLSPQRFFYRVRETAKIRFYVGENFTGENWSGNRDKVVLLDHYLPSGEKRSLAATVSENKGDSVSVPLSEAGTHMIVFRSANSFIRLEAGKFGAYLEEDGLTDAIQYRRLHNEEKNDGREYYQRSVKTIIQAGDKFNEQCTEPTGLPLDIIPGQNPYVLPETLGSSSLPKVDFRVLFKGKPLANATVKVWYQLAGRPVAVENLKTNKRGFITTNRYPGRIMVSCVHMERNNADTAADWQSYWGSLSFEYSKFFAAQ